MKVLWLSPWMRPLSRVQTDALRAAGADVRLVTTDQHPESGPAVDGEWVVDTRFKRPSTWPEFCRLRRQVRDFAPDVVVTELVRDPRWMLLDRSAPRVDIVHDDRPHDDHEQLPAWERRAFARWRASSCLTITHSQYVSDRVASTRARVPTTVTPLASDLAESRVPALVPARERRDFVLTGRLNGYKNIPLVLEAWTRHREGPGHRGDHLILIGEADQDLDLPLGVRWERGSFRYADKVETIARAKASVAHYRRATQSGVQVLAMQLGVMPIVSDQGGLPELQPPGGPVVDIDDVAGLARAFDVLADSEHAADAGITARRAFEQRHAPAAVGAALSEALGRVARA
ncbi:glycosyltransferase family 4 protein [Aeromicrobium sp. CF3.5]|uniref:glycosyltransferase family 4 protein n=1 Tax=Aeromicrobium sp. CF3.5 TaxID=3373078 RepID=UPI003EE45B0D